MMSRELILDTNVVLADVFQESSTLQSVEAMKAEARRSAVGLLITKTVKKESVDTLGKEMLSLSETLRELRDFVLGKKRGAEQDDYKVMVQEKDLDIVQEYFRTKMYTVRKAMGRKERLRRLMEYVVAIFHAIKEERPAAELFTEANVGIVRLDTEFTTTLETYKRNVAPYAAREGEVRLMKRKLKIKNTKDVRILIESAQYHTRKNPRTVFTTLDSGDIMNSAPLIETHLQLKVRDPLLAVNEVIRL